MIDINDYNNKTANRKIAADTLSGNENTKGIPADIKKLINLEKTDVKNCVTFKNKKKEIVFFTIQIKGKLTDIVVRRNLIPSKYSDTELVYFFKKLIDENANVILS